MGASLKMIEGGKEKKEGIDSEYWHMENVQNWDEGKNPLYYSWFYLWFSFFFPSPPSFSLFLAWPNLTDFFLSSPFLALFPLV